MCVEEERVTREKRPSDPPVVAAAEFESISVMPVVVAKRPMAPHEVQGSLPHCVRPLTTLKAEQAEERAFPSP
jgi:hypothetical protein